MPPTRQRMPADPPVLSRMLGRIRDVSRGRPCGPVAGGVGAVIPLLALVFVLAR